MGVIASDGRIFSAAHDFGDRPGAEVHGHGRRRS